jgi:PEP-CTERM motif
MQLNFVGKSSIRALLISSATLLGLAVPAFSTNITVPDGTFNVATNDGTVGGILGSGSGLQIGTTGPWQGNYSGILGLVGGPTLDISPGQATISGIVGLNVLGLLDNGGDFTTTLTNAGSGSAFAYAANTTYTLTANVSAGTVLALNVLAADGVGIALTSGGSIIASTANPGSLLTLLSGNTYTLSMQYTTPTTGGPDGGAIGIELYDIPSGLATANLLGAATFSNVTLSTPTQSPATPEPAALLLSGAGLLGLGFMGRRKMFSRG